MTDNAKIRVRVNSLRILRGRQKIVIICQMFIRTIIIISIRIVLNDGCLNYNEENDEVLNAGFGCKGHAIGNLCLDFFFL